MNRTRRIATSLVAVAALGGVAACGSGGGSDSEDITLRVNLFGKFGYEEAYEKFEASHPGVTIVETAEGDLGKYNTKLTQQIAAGGDAGDVVAIEEGQTVAFLAAADKFVNLKDEGGQELKDRWLPWVWDKTTTADGAATIGYGTDIGGLAMCYRRDLFEKAGLPTDRDEVAELWPTWKDYISTGKDFEQGIGDDKVNFLDSSTNTYNSILMQQGDVTYFDRDDNVVIDSNPAVRTAWDDAVEMTEAGLSSQLKAFSEEWNAGFKNGTFATVACPAWMTGYIKEQSGESNAGQWDIATVPGGAGNWGGSWLAVPKSSQHQEMALELIEYLSGEEGQMLAFEAEGRLPSLPALFDTPELKDSTNEYFNDAPVGQLFVSGAEQLEPVYLGAKNVPVRDAVENALRSVENGEVSPAKGWSAAVSDGEKAAR